MKINLQIKNVRNIKNANLCLDVNGGVYALVGGNGSGKSTIMLMLSLIVRKSSRNLLGFPDYDETSKVTIRVDDNEDVWEAYINRSGGKTLRISGKPTVKELGFYEGSVFYGTRFADSDKVSEFILRDDFSEEVDLKKIENYVSEKMSYILTGDLHKYKDIYRVKSKKIATKYGFSGIPFFRKTDKGNFITQLGMSSGESMILSVVDIIHSHIFANIGRDERRILFIFDEIDLALHPAAINRMKLYFDDLIAQYKNTISINVIFSTHSGDLISSLNPNNIFMIDNVDGEVEIINPSYPSYTIRTLAQHAGYDYLILVEDQLAKLIVEDILSKGFMQKSKLICVLPGGGYTQLMQLNKDLISNNVLGINTKTILVFDGDVEREVLSSRLYSDGIKKAFLPVQSVEKHLKHMLIENPDRGYIKLIGDRFFRLESLDSIIEKYKLSNPSYKVKDKSGKTFYKHLVINLAKINITEEMFVSDLPRIIATNDELRIKIDKFSAMIETLLS